MEISKKIVIVLVDIGVSHTFLREILVGKLWFKVSMTNKMVKLLKCKAKETKGLTSYVQIQIDDLKGCLDFIVTKMNNFKVMTGHDFLRGSWVLPMSWRD